MQGIKRIIVDNVTSGVTRAIRVIPVGTSNQGLIVKYGTFFYLLSLLVASCGDSSSSSRIMSAGSELIITVYENCGYAGDTLAGDGDNARMPQGASSFKIKDGYQITLCSGENFSGETLVRTSSDDCLVNEGWNDRARSFRLTASVPVTWQEHWFEHAQLLQRVYLDDQIAVYYDSRMDRPSTQWLNPMLNNAWRYTKNTYGAFGPDARLFAIFHQNNYGGGHPSTYFDSSHDYRNVIDLATNAPWSLQSGWTVEATIHEIGHIVEGASHGLHGSPSFGLWGDSKWCEIFVYDVLRNIGMGSEADRVLRQFSSSASDFPRKQSYWFRDWYLPIYRDFGGARVLNRYFELLAQRLPRQGSNFAHDLNWGEYVHFMSGAAGKDLKPLATRAFGWTAEWEQQRAEAQRRFPLAYGL